MWAIQRRRVTRWRGRLTQGLPLENGKPGPKEPAHRIIEEYDQRADVENLVGEAKREGVDMLPSAKFKSNDAFFQMVMPAYNIWCYMKMMARKNVSDTLKRKKFLSRKKPNKISIHYD